MTKKGKWYVSTIGDGEGVIRKTTRRHGRYKLAGTGSRGCGNYQALSEWWRDVSCHGWRITSDSNHLGGGPVVRAWDQEVCSLCGLRFEPWDCSYDGH